LEERREAEGDNLAINFFMMPAIRKPIAKNNVTNNAMLIMNTFSPYGIGEYMTEFRSHRSAKLASRKGIAIKKKSCAFMFPHYNLFGSSILLLRTLRSVRKSGG